MHLNEGKFEPLNWTRSIWQQFDACISSYLMCLQNTVKILQKPNAENSNWYNCNIKFEDFFYLQEKTMSAGK